MVETLCPEMRVGCRFDKRRIDPDLVPRAPDAAFEHIVDPKLAADFLGVHALIFIRKRSIARHDQNILQSRQIRGQIIGDPICEVLLLGVIAEVREGQDGN